MNCKICGQPLRTYNKQCPFCGSVTPYGKKMGMNDANNYENDNIPLEIIVAKDNTKKKDILPLLVLLSLACALLIGIVLFDSIAIEHREHQERAASVSSYHAYNGEIIIVPDYECVCPLEVNVEKGTDYYIRLKYLRASNSDVGRRLTYSASEPYESDIAFYVKSGRSAQVNVPIGVYKFYYATGHTFYGTKELFGNETLRYEAKQELSFSVKGNTYGGHSITLKKVPFGNLGTHSVNKNSFPTE